MTKRSGSDSWSGLMQFINLSLYLGAVVVISIGASYWLGRFLDDRLGQDYVFTIVGLIAGSGIAFYVILRRLMDIGRGKDWRRR